MRLYSYTNSTCIWNVSDGSIRKGGYLSVVTTSSKPMTVSLFHDTSCPFLSYASSYIGLIPMLFISWPSYLKISRIPPIYETCTHRDLFGAMVMLLLHVSTVAISSFLFSGRNRWICVFAYQRICPITSQKDSSSFFSFSFTGCSWGNLVSLVLNHGRYPSRIFELFNAMQNRPSVFTDRGDEKRMLYGASTLEIGMTIFCSVSYINCSPLSVERNIKLL